EDVTVKYTGEEITVTVDEIGETEKETPKETLINLMSRWQKGNIAKMKPYVTHLRKAQTKEEILAALQKSRLPVALELAIAEKMKEI
ncbi:MAG: hypothetical protein IKI78_01645, partial [Clostridia bacterium]|nr:hypothetical protein [Clostridia bacterium]